MPPKHSCRQCGKPFRVRTVDGLRYARSLLLSVIDKDGLFCTMNCAATFGVAAATDKDKDKPREQPSIH